jgi:hypothetical protein
MVAACGRSRPDAAYLCRAAQKVNKNIALQYRISATTFMPNSADNLTN